MNRTSNLESCLVVISPLKGMHNSDFGIDFPVIGLDQAQFWAQYSINRNNQ